MTEPAHQSTARAVYDHSADLYVQAVGTSVSPEFEAPLDRALLAGFAEQAQALDGPVLDIGCGPGRVARFLADRGLAASGVDISAEMVAAARAAHPHLHFEPAPLDALPVADASLAAAVYWYSIIATPADALGNAWQELDRVLRADGVALVAFQAGEGQAVQRADAYGSGSTLTLYRHDVDHVMGSLESAGFANYAQTVRQPRLGHETNPQAFLIVTR